MMKTNYQEKIKEQHNERALRVITLKGKNSKLFAQFCRDSSHCSDFKTMFKHLSTEIGLEEFVKESEKIISDEFCKIITREIVSRKITQQAIADFLDIDRANISKRINGDVPFRFHEAYLLCLFLHIEIKIEIKE